MSVYMNSLLISVEEGDKVIILILKIYLFNSLTLWDIINKLEIFKLKLGNAFKTR